MVQAPNPAAQLVNLVITLYWWVILFRLLVDWQAGLRFSMGPAYATLLRATEPYLKPFRRWAPPAWNVDLSGISALVSLLILQEVVIFIARQL
jgi:uncharacterized protein YggT (Ycf19 family)